MSAATKVNKSEEIRKLKTSGVTSASEIVAKLKAKGIKVAPAQVYTVLSKEKTHSKAQSKKAATSGTTNGKHSVIDDAIVFVRSAGGMASAKELLNKLSLLQN